MPVDDLNSHIEDILDVLSEGSEKSVNKEELEKELKKFIEYGVPIDQAKQTLIKKFGGGATFTAPSSSERKLISDLQPNESSVRLLCRVIAINPKEITVKGENRRIFYGIFGDESGTIQFTAWNDFDIEKGTVVEITNAYTREWQETTQLNLGDRVTIKKMDDDKLPESAYEPKEAKIVDLRSGIGTVDVTARIIDVNERETEVDGQTKKVFSGIIGDETGKAQFTSWHDFGFKKGDVARITGGYVKSWKGIPQLTFDEKATVKKLDKSKFPKSEVELRFIPIHQLVEKRGALDVKVEGTVIEIREGSGLIMRCPECNRTLMNEECQIHGKVKGKSDLRIKLVIDDGTGAVSAIMNREMTEKLLGKTLDDYQKLGNQALIDEMNTMLFAKRMVLRGNALGDAFGTTVITKDAQLIDVDIKEKAVQLTETLEALR
jgi:replication factor A1